MTLKKAGITAGLASKAAVHHADIISKHVLHMSTLVAYTPVIIVA
jgi:hypothetical protein